jgi:hypothetical protein
VDFEAIIVSADVLAVDRMTDLEVTSAWKETPQ